MSSYGTTICDIARCGDPWKQVVTIKFMEDCDTKRVLYLKHHIEIKVCKKHNKDMYAPSE